MFILQKLQRSGISYFACFFGKKLRDLLRFEISRQIIPHRVLYDTRAL